MSSSSISSIYQSYQSLIGKNVTVKGWVRTFRSQKDMTFLSVSDGSTLKHIQVVFDSKILSEEQSVKLAFGCSVIACGTLVESPVPAQPFELNLSSSSDLEICGGIIGISPLPSKGKITLEFLRTIPHLRPRTNTFGAIARMRHELAMATHDFYGQEKHFILVAPPQITQNDCEGGGEAFQVTTLLSEKTKIAKALPSDDFFKAPAYLTVSGQLALETYCLALGGVYCYQSAFRADPSQTSRHVAEFTMLEVEIPFADLSDNMDLAEEYIKYCIQQLMQKCFIDMQFLDQFYYQKRASADKFKPTLVEYLDDLLTVDFARMKYSEVMQTLLKVQAEGHQFEVALPEHGVFDLKSEHERYLTDVILKKPVFVTHYPKDIKAFYMKESSEVDPILSVPTVECCDLLVPGIGEVLGGSCRISDYEKLLESMKTHGLVKADGSSDLEYYLDLRKYGSVEHCGFGIGMSRLLMMLTGMENIRDVIEFPRTIGSIRF